MYNQHRIYRVFQLIHALKSGPPKSVGSLAKMLGITTRSVYRYVDLLEELGLKAERDAHGRMFLAPGQEGAAGWASGLTPQEADYLERMVLTAGRDHPLAEGVLAKIRAASEVQAGAELTYRAHAAQHVEALSRAMQEQKQVVLRGYYSASSQSVSDRRVEPVRFTENYASISAFEVETGMNKYFNVERITAVEVLDRPFECAASHAFFAPDVFGFQGHSDPQEVEWVMTLRARLLLQEEYPASAACIHPTDDPQLFRFHAPVYSFKGPGRFVRGFPDDVTVVGSGEFLGYLNSDSSG